MPPVRGAQEAQIGSASPATALVDMDQARLADPAAERYSLLRRRGRWKDALRRRMLALADLLAWLTGAVIANLTASGATTLGWILATLPLWVLIAKARHLYALDHAR